MTSPSPLASSPSDFKASSPTDIRHLRQQAPQDYAQEKIPKLKFVTSTSYYDLDIDHAFLSMEHKNPRSISNGSA